MRVALLGVQPGVESAMVVVIELNVQEWQRSAMASEVELNLVASGSRPVVEICDQPIELLQCAVERAKQVIDETLEVVESCFVMRMGFKEEVKHFC